MSPPKFKNPDVKSSDSPVNSGGASDTGRYRLQPIYSTMFDQTPTGDLSKKIKRRNKVSMIPHEESFPDINRSLAQIEQGTDPMPEIHPAPMKSLRVKKNSSGSLSTARKLRKHLKNFHNENLVQER